MLCIRLKHNNSLKRTHLCMHNDNCLLVIVRMDLMGDICGSSGTDMVDCAIPAAGTLKRSSRAPMINLIAVSTIG